MKAPWLSVDVSCCCSTSCSCSSHSPTLYKTTCPHISAHFTSGRRFFMCLKQSHFIQLHSASTIQCVVPSTHTCDISDSNRGQRSAASFGHIWVSIGGACAQESISKHPNELLSVCRLWQEKSPNVSLPPKLIASMETEYECQRTPCGTGSSSLLISLIDKLYETETTKGNLSGVSFQNVQIHTDRNFPSLTLWKANYDPLILPPVCKKMQLAQYLQ